MALQKVILLTKRLEDTNNPLLGPVLKGLYFFGMLTTGSRFRTVLFNFIHASSVLYFISQVIDLYTVRNDINKAMNNLSLTALSIICIAKWLSFILRQKEWRKLIKEVADEEIIQINKRDPTILNAIARYTKYTRVVTYLYWVLVFLTNLLLIISPYLKFITSANYRSDVKNGLEPWPQMLRTWVPFDNTKMPGYIIGVLINIFMSSQGSGIIANFDAHAVAIMTYLKGHMDILREEFTNIFEDQEVTADILSRIRECHRHHNVLLKHLKMFKSLLSPVMFLYVLVCSGTICCSVVQFRSSDISASQKLWLTQYTVGLICQLFLYCWHSNEVAVESIKLDRCVYNCDWWKRDARLRRQILLLAGKFTKPFVLDAGPFTRLSIPTFTDIIKGSYSFYALISHIQDK